ncbi:hypothetical protein ACFE04_022575 [Oxalis oulophora]
MQLLLLVLLFVTFNAFSVDAKVPRAVPREVYDNGKIYDITHKITSKLPSWDSNNGLGSYIWLTSSIKNGSLDNVSEFKLTTHTGTHCDAPGHFYQDYYDAGYDATTLNLQVLNGPALLVDVPRNTNITADVMKSLNIPRGVRRVLFRTLNTDRRLMFQTRFDSSYVGFMPDGAKWLVENTDIKLVGLDYLSVAAYVDLAAVHLIFLKNRDIIPLEGLKLDNIAAGEYNVHCLPIKLAKGDGAPTRCILTSTCESSNISSYIESCCAELVHCRYNKRILRSKGYKRLLT